MRYCIVPTQNPEYWPARKPPSQLLAVGREQAFADVNFEGCHRFDVRPATCPFFSPVDRVSGHDNGAGDDGQFEVSFPVAQL